MIGAAKSTTARVRLWLESLVILPIVLIGAACATGHEPRRASPYVTLRHPSTQFARTWLQEPPREPNLITSVPGRGATAVGIVTTRSSGGPDSDSQLTSVYARASRSYAGLSYAGGRVDRQDVWYHVRLNLPSAHYAPTTGEWNWLVEWHDDPHTAPTGTGPYSMAMGVYTDLPAVRGAVGRNPHFALRLSGGNATTPTYQSIELRPRVREDHWYNLLFHFVWSTRATIGLVQWFVDGKQIVSKHFPTLYVNPDGTHSFNSFGIYNYHWACPWSSTVEFDDVAIGPTRKSVDG